MSRGIRKAFQGSRSLLADRESIQQQRGIFVPRRCFVSVKPSIAAAYCVSILKGHLRKSRVRILASMRTTGSAAKKRIIPSRKKRISLCHPIRRQQAAGSPHRLFAQVFFGYTLNSGCKRFSFRFTALFCSSGAKVINVFFTIIKMHTFGYKKINAGLISSHIHEIVKICTNNSRNNA